LGFSGVLGMDHPDPLITPREFAQRTGLTTAHVRRLLRQGLLCGAQRTVTRRWRIPRSAIGFYLQGVRPQLVDAGRTSRERLRRLWLETEGTEWPLYT